MIRFKRLPSDIYQRIQSLRKLFLNDPNIIFAYLFGGLLKDRVNPLSDADIAVFLKDVKKSSYLDLFCKITDILCSDEVDLIILNLSPLSLTGRILQNRKILIDKDPFLRHKYESLTLRKYFDFSMKERDILKRRYGIG